MRIIYSMREEDSPVKLLLIAPPTAHRQAVAAFLEERGAAVHVASRLQPPGTVGSLDAIVALDPASFVMDEIRRRHPHVPVVVASADHDTGAAAAAERPALAEGGSSAGESSAAKGPSGAEGTASNLRELAFRVAQAVHGTRRVPAEGAPRPVPSLLSKRPLRWDPARAEPNPPQLRPVRRRTAS